MIAAAAAAAAAWRQDSVILSFSQSGWQARRLLNGDSHLVSGFPFAVRVAFKVLCCAAFLLLLPSSVHAIVRKQRDFFPQSLSYF